MLDELRFGKIHSGFLFQNLIFVGNLSAITAIYIEYFCFLLPFEAILSRLNRSNHILQFFQKSHIF